MERAGVKVNRTLGVRGSGILSHNRGVRRTMDLLAAAPRLSRLVWRLRSAASQYSVLYVHGYRELLLSAIALGMVPQRSRPALVWHCHGIGDGRVPPLLPLLARRCRCLIAVSNDVVSRLQELEIHGPHIRRIYNALDIVRIRCQIDQSPLNLPGRQTGQKTLLIAGACLRADKGADIMIRTAAPPALICPMDYR